ARRWSGRLDRGRTGLADLQDGGRLADRVPAPSGISDLADGMVRAAVVADPIARECRRNRYRRCDSGRALSPHPRTLLGPLADGRRGSTDRLGARTHARHANLLPAAATW